MKSSRVICTFAIAGSLIWLLVVSLSAMQGFAIADGGAVVQGIVVDADGPVAGAVVRQRTTYTSTTSDADGTFTLAGVSEGVSVTITAWDEGYYPGGVEVIAPIAGITITLIPHPTGDNTDHQWYTSMPDPGQPIGCGHCMVAFPQWVTNAHGTSGTNPRFFSLYNGTDVTGTATITPGYKLDFPGMAGNCATCHAPGAAANEPFTTDMNALVGVEQEGVFCDYCHKVSGVYLNPVTNLPYPNMPGVQSIQLNRPPSNTHMFYGPFDDVTRRVSYLDLEKKSQFCAPFHQFSFWGTPIYESYAEWLASDYPAQGIECQACHMAPTGVDYFVYPEQGGLTRPPQLIASHLQPGASDTELLQNTVSMTLSVHQAVDRLQVTVVITNTGAGHHVPTDFPGRHMILVVEATDGEGQALTLLSGSTVPGWGGAQAGLPGKAFAKLLRDAQTGEWPVVSYWKQTFLVSDNRIPAMGSDASTYEFALPSTSGVVTVTAELRFRRVFQGVTDAKGWDKPDIVMEDTWATLPTVPWSEVFMPLALRDTP
jgi:hypothetical protein